MIEKLPRFIAQPLFSVINNWDWLHKKVNALAINQLCKVCPQRPHPWSTIHDYTSWTALTDQHWSARHLQAVKLSNLPELDALVELFKRPVGKQELCKKSTCLFPAFAQYLTDGLIRTRMPNTSEGESEQLRRQTTSNHQIDLSTLYGRTAAQTDALRLKREKLGERGRLKSRPSNGEEYSEFLYHEDGKTIRPEFKDLDAPLGLDKFPDASLRARLFAAGGDRVNAAPHISAVNTLFLREHNRVAGEIEKRNPEWDDERVFQTTRNCLIVIFIKIIVEEYINHITSEPLQFIVDPSVAWTADWNRPNWITTEFSLLYRWHSLIPDRMTWSGKPVDVGLTLMDNRYLLDAGLVRAFQDMSAQPAGRLGALNTASWLLDIEKLAIKQGRLCNVALYSKYRKYVSLPQPRSFEDISTRPAVVDLLRKAYGRLSDVEFYIGLFCEDTVKNSPLPKLILTMVAMDAFSQAFTNPLLGKQVFNSDTFTPFGLELIHSTSKLHDVLERNCPAGLGPQRISMTRADWRYE